MKKSKNTAAVWALFLGGVGAHHFYLGNTGRGILYLLFFWTFIPALVAFLEIIVLLTTDDANFDQKYNFGLTASTSSPVDDLKKLNELRLAGALTDEEFNEKKEMLMGRVI